MTKTKKNPYSSWEGLKRTLKNGTIVLLPFVAVQLVNVLPNNIAEMSVGALISYGAYMFKNWLKNK